MPLLVLGINHNTAPVRLREQVAFVPEQLPFALKQARERLDIEEIAILSTCNRTELYAALPAVEAEQQVRMGEELLHWLAQHHGVEVEDFAACSYRHHELEVVRHLMRVACGLDSMVLGEPQILGQIKSAYAIARQASALGQQLEKLFQTTFSVAKQVRTETSIGENPVSVAYAAVSLAQHIFADMKHTRALLIGAGKTIDLVAKHLRQSGVREMIVANRTLERAEQLAQGFGARAIMFADIPRALLEVDVIIASTASQLPILGKGAVERALKQRKHRPMYMVDLAVPRDIEPEVGELADVYLYSIDDLKQVIDANLKTRQGAMADAEALIAVGLANFVREQRAQEAVGALTAYRQKAQALRDVELERAQRQLLAGRDPQQVLEHLAHALTNKLIHMPSVQLKQASAEGRADLLQWARQLLGIETGSSLDETPIAPEKPAPAADSRASEPPKPAAVDTHLPTGTKKIQ